MAADINWHRHGTKLRHCHPLSEYLSQNQPILTRIARTPVKLHRCGLLLQTLRGLCLCMSGTSSIGSIDSPLSSSITLHSFVPGLKPFSANPSHHSLPFLLQDSRHTFSIYRYFWAYPLLLFSFFYFFTFWLLVPCGRLDWLVSYRIMCVCVSVGRSQPWAINS